VLYGLTDFAGAGTLFRLAPSGSTPTYTHIVIYRFKGGNDGFDPDDTPGLVADRSGNLYGTTVTGGTYNSGTVFEVIPRGKHSTEHVLYTFHGGQDGANPYGGVIIDRAGNLLGPTEYGGQYNVGTIFSICCAPPTK
jgi:uncharacterized repeat protein (TIGR03803 family)